MLANQYFLQNSHIQIVLLMQYLSIVLGLLSKTSSRDTILRLAQYATLHSVDQIDKGAVFNVYSQMRKTRKVLRFLRTIQHTSQIRKQISALKKQTGNNKAAALRLLVILQHVFTVLFYLCDHRVFLGELEVIDKSNVQVYYPRSMKMYRFQNIFGAVKCVAQIMVVFVDGSYEGQPVDLQKRPFLIKKLLVELIRNILDIFIAQYYLNRPVGKAKTYGIIGMITSTIGIAQALGKI